MDENSFFPAVVLMDEFLDFQLVPAWAFRMYRLLNRAKYLEVGTGFCMKTVFVNTHRNAYIFLWDASQ